MNEYALNWDMAGRREIGFADIFKDPPETLAFATAYCANDLRRQDPDAGADDYRRAAVADVVKSPRNWLLGTDKVSVHFTVYSVTSFAGGEHDVDIPYAALMHFLKPDAIVLKR